MDILRAGRYFNIRQGAVPKWSGRGLQKVCYWLPARVISELACPAQPVQAVIRAVWYSRHSENTQLLPRELLQSIRQVE